MMFSYVRLCSLMFSYVRLYPLMRGNARSLRLPGRFGTVCRGESGPTLGLRCAAGSFARWHHATARDTHEKRTGFEAAPAASPAGHVGPGLGSRRTASRLAVGRMVSSCKYLLYYGYSVARIWIIC